MRLALMLVVWSPVSGCYLAHERPATDIDAGPAIDVGSCGGPVPSCASGARVVDLMDAAPGCTGGRDFPECVTFEVLGTDAIAEPEGLCRRGAVDVGTHVVVRRCAPGSVMGSIDIEALEAPGLPAGVLMTSSDDGCACSGVDRVMAGGSVAHIVMFGPVTHLSFFGEGSRYRVRACAFTSCP